MMRGKSMDRRWIDIDAIHIGDRLREPDMARVTVIAKSIAEVGLLNPPAVRLVEKMIIGGVEEYNVPILIVGHHRILALQQNGQESVECDVYHVDPLRAELMELAENLHRAELTALERSEQVARWIKLVALKKEEDISRQADAKPKAGRPEGGVRSAARELNLSEADARRAIKVASLSPEAKAVAVKAGLTNNRSALLEAASRSDPNDQVVSLQSWPRHGGHHAIAAATALPALAVAKAGEETLKRKLANAKERVEETDAQRQEIATLQNEVDRLTKENSSLQRRCDMMLEFLRENNVLSQDQRDEFVRKVCTEATEECTQAA